MMLTTLALAVVLALSHLFCGKLRFRTLIPKRHWLSLAGGISVAYVFVHLLPHLSGYQDVIERTDLLGFLENHAYLMALLGLAIFYGLERGTSPSEAQPSGALVHSSRRDFWLHVVAFGLYNAIIGYLLMAQQAKVGGAVLFTVAMALHFVVNDNALRQRHHHLYDAAGRWILAACVTLGWFVGNLFVLGEPELALLYAFLAGGIILNVLKEELPEEKESHFPSFFLGAAVFTVLLVVMEAA